MRGRKPPGPEFVYRLRGSAASKQRAEVILQTLAGRRRLTEASAALGITTQRFHALRQVAVQALVSSLEAQPVGRPPQPPAGAAEPAAEVARLEHELAAARLRLEIALLLPGRAGAAAARKKKPPRSK
jgi:hypothetical protein